MSRIQELEAEIQRIKKEEADKKKALYQHFVGKYVRRAHTSYEKIIGIDRSTRTVEVRNGWFLWRRTALLSR